MYTNKASSKHTVSLLYVLPKASYVTFSWTKCLDLSVCHFWKRKWYGEINDYILYQKAKEFISKFLSLNQNTKLIQQRDSQMTLIPGP